MGIDGVVFDVPDSAANDAAFGALGRARGDGAFPRSASSAWSNSGPMSRSP